MDNFGNPDYDEIWTLVFTKAQQPHLIHRWMNPKFQHVFAMKRTPADQFWIILNPALNHTEAMIQPIRIYPTARDYHPDATEILTVKTRYDSRTHNKHLSFITCVDIMKSLLGIKDTFCLTPYQLYKNLMGGKYGRCTATRQERSEASGERATALARRTTAQRATARLGS